MKKIYFFLIFSVFLTGCNESEKSSNNYVIKKEGGQIILAYKVFNDFLSSDRSWKSYKSMMLDAYPSMQKIHNRLVEWGSVDTVKFASELKSFRKEDFEKYNNQYTPKAVNYLYDSVIARSQRILPLLNKKKTDLCIFMPYEGCFVIPGRDENLICISVYISPDESQKIMTHEYAHVLHIDRRPEEPLSLKREIISEGMAVYLTTRILTGIPVSHAIPFMTEDSFNWCMQNEPAIKDSIKAELNDTTIMLFKRYISDGDFAEPPAGFVQKTGFFAGYRIIEKCINKGITLEKICSLNSDEVIKLSGYF